LYCLGILLSVNCRVHELVGYSWSGTAPSISILASSSPAVTMGQIALSRSLMQWLCNFARHYHCNRLFQRHILWALHNAKSPNAAWTFQSHTQYESGAVSEKSYKNPWNQLH
jgi:hypothetical protein